MASLFLRRTSGLSAHRASFGSLGVVSSLALSSRRGFAWTGERYQGYVSYFNADQLFGFAVRDDLPEREYYFHSTDIMCQSVPRVRPLQPVSFSVHEGRSSNQYLARDIAAPDGSAIVFNHPNLRLRAEERTRKLSELPDFEAKRHTGIVVSSHADGRGGLIIPDRLNYDVVQFYNSELQTTGAERIDKFAEVEFFVRQGRNRDRAVCITRRGGQLITAERRETGQIRRALGSMYTLKDLAARLPTDFRHERKTGYIQFYNGEKMFGWIATDDSDELVFVHVDDCHLCGKRSLRRFQEVEFSLVRDEETGKSKAMHVTGPKATVLRYISDNHYVPRPLTTKQFTPTDGRILGEVARSEAGRFILIKPVQQGYEQMLAPMSEVKTVGRTRLMPGDSVEFTVGESQVREDHEDEDRAGFIATEVTRPGGKPFVFEGGDFGNYLRARSSLPSDAGSLPPVDADTGKQTGWIASYSNRMQRGLIEVRAPAGKRYQKIKFELADTNVDGSQASRASESELQPGDSYVTINAGMSVEFDVKTAELDGEHDVIERRAVGITGSEGSQIPFRIRSVQLESERRSYGRDDHDDGHEEEEDTRRSHSKEPLDL